MTLKLEYESIDALLSAALDTPAELSQAASHCQLSAEAAPRPPAGTLTAELVGVAFGGLSAQLKRAKDL